jgi:signal transduction histidine kinase/AraC-like DNA-binding protein
MSHALRIGVAIDSNDPYWVQVREAAYTRAQELPLDLVSISLVDHLESLSQEEQLALLEELLALELDALIAWALPEGPAHSFPQFGMPLVLLSETAVRHPLLVSPLGLYDAAQMGCFYLAEKLAGRGNVLTIGGSMQSGPKGSGESRTVGVRDALRDHVGITPICIPCPWLYEYEQAYRQLHKTMQPLSGPIDAVFGLSDVLALAGRDVGQALDLIDQHTPVVGIGGTPAALEAITNGSMTATVEIRTDELGKQAVDLAYRAAQGLSLPAHFEYQARLVTAQNAAEVTAQKLTAVTNLYNRMMDARRQQQQQRLTQLETSLEISRRVGSILDRRQLSHEIANLIRANYGYERVQIFRWLEEEQVLTLEQSDQPRAGQTDIPLAGSGVLGQALMRNEPIFIPDTHRSPRFPPDPNWPATRTRVVLPIRIGDKVLGLLDLHSHRSSPRTRQELVGLQSLADQLGVALENAGLYEEALRAQGAAEKADRIKTRLLANVSHELRTPLNTVLGYIKNALESPNPYAADLPPTLLKDLQRVYRSAEHLLHVINDLLDLSRAEIDELALSPEIIDPRPLLEEVFHTIANGTPSRGQVSWHLQLPNRLPAIQADLVRLRQVLLNLLNNACKFTDTGRIVLGAEITPPRLHIWVQDTGIGIPIDMQERIFEPFVTAEHTGRRGEGIGLGLSITRQLVALHGGSMTLESQPGQGSTFHVYLPLPSLSDQPASPFPASAQPVLLLISAQDQPAAEIVSFCQRQGLEMHRLQASDDMDQVVAEVRPAALAWDQASANSGDWVLIQQLRNHPQLCRAPFILYGQGQGEELELVTGVTDFVVKPVSGKTLMGAINALCPPASAGPVLIVDDDPQARELYRGIVAKGFPGYPIRTANDGAAALVAMAEETPCLVILDLMMPEVDGFEVLDWMRANPKTRQNPVLVLTGRMLTLEDIKRLEQHALVTFQGKGVLSEEETAASLHRLLIGEDALPPHTSGLVKRAIAYLHRNYNQPLSRQQIAKAIGVSENYLSHIFRRELGLSPWEYLTRYRIKRAKELLNRTSDSITSVAFQVGFNDPAYFSRVFRKQVGLSPSAFREQGE